MNEPRIPGARLPRRTFLKNAAAGVGALASGHTLLAGPLSGPDVPGKPAYRGPNVILIRFGGGTRRRESIEPDHTYSPFLCHELARRGTLFPNMEIDKFRDIHTSHGE